MPRYQEDKYFHLGYHTEIIKDLYGEDTLNELANGELDEETIEQMKEAVLDVLDKENGELNAIAVVYSKADRIITHTSDLTVTIHKPDSDETHFNGIAGWSDGKNIIFNQDEVTLMSENDVPALNGLNYHELGHIFYTPRGGSELVTWVLDNNLGKAFNYLEDCRIETLMTARFPSTRLFLESNFMRYVANDDTNNAELYLLARGRKYVPLAIRQKVADLYVSKYGLKMAVEVADIIDTYRTLVLTRDSSIAKPLIERFAKIVGTGNTPQGRSKTGEGEGGAGEGGECDFDCGGREPMKFGRPNGVKQQEADSQKAKGQTGKSEELREQESNEILNGGNNKGEQNNIENDNVDDSQFMKQDSEKISLSLKELIEQRAKDIKSDSNVRREVREFREAINSNDEHRSGMRNARYQNMKFHELISGSEYPAIAEQFGRELERLEIDNEPSWDKEKPSGRLNVQRTMNAGLNDIDRLFDQWSDVDYSTEIEAVILLDNSGSMGGRIQSASASVWAIKRGLERINANTTVFSFNSGSRLLYSADERTSHDSVRTVYTGGTTNPIRALNEGKQILNLSTRATKMLFIITDGGFDCAEPCDDVIKEMNEDGVITSTVFIGYLNQEDFSEEYLEMYRHHAKHFNVVRDPKDIINVATTIVTEQLGVFQ
jgi:hypothetical protein